MEGVAGLSLIVDIYWQCLSWCKSCIFNTEAFKGVPRVEEQVAIKLFLTAEFDKSRSLWLCPFRNYIHEVMDNSRLVDFSSNLVSMDHVQ